MSHAGTVEETDESPAKKLKLEEMREQLKTKEEELKMAKDELKMKDKELSKEREERLAEKRELEKLRRQTPGKIGFVDEGSKKWEVEVDKIGEEEVFSDYTSSGDVPFRIRCKTEIVSGTKNLGVYLRCNDEAPTTTFFASVDFTLTLASTVTPHSKTGLHNYTAASGRGWHEFIAWTDLLDPSKGYIQNGRITIDARIKLIWYDKNTIYDFSSPDPQLTDVILLVGGKEFHVCKKHIAIYSEFFKTFFLSDFAEKGKERLELPEVDAKEFEDLLRSIHPQRRTTVTKDNVEYLLRLSDYFVVDVVRWQCIDFLKESANFSLVAKLKLAEQYRLAELQNEMLNKMTTRETVKGVIDSPDFKTLSDPLSHHILLKHYNLL